MGAAFCVSHNLHMQFVTYLPGTPPLVLDSPHSGTHYPDDFGYACALERLRCTEDTHVDQLYRFAPDLGVAWIEAHFPRSYIDTNRDTAEIDPEMFDSPWPHPLVSDETTRAKVHLGKGLIWRSLDDGSPIYQRRLTVAEVLARIDRCWQPYHAAVAEAIDAAHQRHGYSIHLNCHSMPSVAGSHATNFPGLAHADIVIGNRDASSSSAELAQLVCQHFADLGYSVSYNHPYKGVELVRRYGVPGHDRHSIQVEINRKLYMNETTLKHTAGFAPLQAHLRALVERLLRTDPRTL